MKKLDSPINYGKSLDSLNRELRNPMLVHKIQDAILAIESESILAISFKKSAKENIGGCIASVYTAYEDNSFLICQLLGKEIINLISEFTGKTLPFVDKRPENTMTQEEINQVFKTGDSSWIQKEAPKSLFTEEELKKLDEEDMDDPDRRYHR